MGHYLLHIMDWNKCEIKHQTQAGMTRKKDTVAKTYTGIGEQ